MIRRLSLVACLGLVMIGCQPSRNSVTATVPPAVVERPIYKVTRYGADGSVLKVWENVVNFSTWSHSNRVDIVDAQSGKTTVNFGTIVVEQVNTRSKPRPTNKSWTVTLYGTNGKAIRSWEHVTDFSTWSHSERLDFVDSENHAVTVFGSLIATED